MPLLEKAWNELKGKLEEKKLYTNKEQWMRKRQPFCYMSLVESSAHQLEISAHIKCHSGRNKNFVNW
jgi:hypothetical protein